MLYITNAFSLNMMAQSSANVRMSPITASEAAHIITVYDRSGDVVSAVGHADTAALLSGLLGIAVPCNRATVSLDHKDRVIIGQYTGPRLPEGARELPEGAQVLWWLVSVEYDTATDAQECVWCGDYLPSGPCQCQCVPQ